MTYLQGILAELLRHGWTCFWTGVHHSAFYCLTKRLP